MATHVLRINARGPRAKEFRYWERISRRKVAPFALRQHAVRTGKLDRCFYACRLAARAPVRSEYHLTSERRSTNAVPALTVRAGALAGWNACTQHGCMRSCHGGSLDCCLRCQPVWRRLGGGWV
jgi:hypothetical protein